MHYFTHHIGDFNNETRHLSRLERSIYRDMRDFYLWTEKPLSLDISDVCKKVLANTKEEATTVEQMLNEFFTKTEQGWYHKTCEEIIDDYHINISAKSAAGKASAAKRAEERLAKLNERSTAVEQTLNIRTTDEQLPITHYPLPNNQEPIKEHTSRKPRDDNYSMLADLLSRNVSEQIAKDWLKVRKVKKLAGTLTAMEKVLKQVEITGMILEDALRLCCERGWGGFEAEWVMKSHSPPMVGGRQPKIENFDAVNYGESGKL